MFRGCVPCPPGACIPQKEFWEDVHFIEGHRLFCSCGAGVPRMRVYLRSDRPAGWYAASGNSDGIISVSMESLGCHHPPQPSAWISDMEML